jgi:hypothetical protein
MKKILAILFVLGLVGCGSEEQLESKPEAVFVNQVVEKLKAEDLSAVKASLDTEALTQPELDKALAETAKFIPKEPISQMNVLEWNFTKMVPINNESRRVANVVLEYNFDDKKWLLVAARVTGEPDSLKINTLRVDVQPQSIAQQNTFTLSNKQPIHYFFLLMGIISIALMIYALVRCIRAPKFKRKWLWALFTLVGFGKISLNWTTGQLFTQLISIQLLGSGIAKVGASPWIISFSFPIGAILLLMKLHKAKKTNNPVDGINE